MVEHYTCVFVELQVNARANVTSSIHRMFSCFLFPWNSLSSEPIHGEHPSVLSSPPIPFLLLCLIIWKLLGVPNYPGPAQSLCTPSHCPLASIRVSGTFHKQSPWKRVDTRYPLSLAVCLNTLLGCGLKATDLQCQLMPCPLPKVLINNAIIPGSFSCSQSGCGVFVYMYAY